MRKVLQVTENDYEWELEDDSSNYEENEELLGEIHLRRKRSPQFGATPFSNISSPFFINTPTITMGDLAGPALVLLLSAIGYYVTTQAQIIVSKNSKYYYEIVY